jgi:hypothetical protein
MRSLVLAVLLLFPAMSFGQNDPLDIVGIDQRLTSVEKDVEELKKLRDEVTALRNTLLAGKQSCPGPDGECVCPPGKCLCPNCPAKHNNGVDLFGDIKKETIAWGGKPNSFGRSAVIESAPDCTNCISLKSRLQDVASNISIKEYDSIENCPRQALPYVALKENGETAVFLTASVATEKRIRDFLSGSGDAPGIVSSNTSTRRVTSTVPSKRVYAAPKTYASPRISTGPSYGSTKTVVRYPGPSWDVEGGAKTYANLVRHLPEHGFSDFSGLSVSQLGTVHDNLHNAGRSGVSYTGGMQQASAGYDRSSTQSYVQPYAQPYRQTYSSAPAYQPMQYFSSGGSYCPSCVR